MKHRLYFMIAIAALITTSGVISQLIVSSFPNAPLRPSTILMVLAAAIGIPTSLYVEKKYFPAKFACRNTNSKILKFVFTFSALAFILACVISVLVYSVFSWAEISRSGEKINFTAFIDYVFEYFPYQVILTTALTGSVIVAAVGLISTFILNQQNRVD